MTPDDRTPEPPETATRPPDPVPDTAAPPESLPTFKERCAPHAAELGDWYTRPRPIDFRTENWDPEDRKGPWHAGGYA